MADKIDYDVGDCIVCINNDGVDGIVDLRVRGLYSCVGLFDGWSANGEAILVVELGELQVPADFPGMETSRRRGFRATCFRKAFTPDVRLQEELLCNA